MDATAADVASVRGQLAAAQQRLEAAQVAAAKAAEAFNGARYEAHQAAEASRLAQERAEAADADLERQRSAYADAAIAAYQMSPQLGALGAISEADGITDVLESTAALQNAQSALQGRYDAYDAAAAVARAADDQAERGARPMPGPRPTGPATPGTPPATPRPRPPSEADTYAAERDRLIGQLARLQGISDGLAGQRQDQLEAAGRRGRRSRGRRSRRPSRQAAGAGRSSRPQAAAAPAAAPTPTPHRRPPPHADPHHADRAADRRTATPTPTAARRPPRTDADPHRPAPAARRRRRPATPRPRSPSRGPSSASPTLRRLRARTPGTAPGLTMRAWQAGGKSLPHYSVAQYQPVDADHAGRAPARRPALLGRRRPSVDLPRGDLHRERDDDPRPAAGQDRRRGVDVLLDHAELLRPPVGRPPVTGR